MRKQERAAPSANGNGPENTPSRNGLANVGEGPRCVESSKFEPPPPPLASQDAQIGLAVALALAAVGIKVFPCVRSRNPKKDKKPLVNDWPGVATVDPDQIHAWWDKWPDARVGVPTGPATGLFVLDADVDDETGETIGQDNLLALGFDVAAHPWKQATPSGGWHCLFRWDKGCPGNTVGKVKGDVDMHGIDTRSVRGYFVVYDLDAVLAAVEALHG